VQRYRPNVTAREWEALLLESEELEQDDREASP
jgi:hypothetical protein